VLLSPLLPPNPQRAPCDEQIFGPDLQIFVRLLRRAVIITRLRLASSAQIYLGAHTTHLPPMRLEVFRDRNHLLSARLRLLEHVPDTLRYSLNFSKNPHDDAYARG
jgi:hypothetical protein